MGLSPILVNQKNEFLVWDTRNVAFAEATFLPSLVFFLSLPDFLTLSPVAVDQPWQTQRLPWLSRTSIALVGSSSYKKSSAFLIWATRRTKKLDGESYPLLVDSSSVLIFSSFLALSDRRKKILRRQSLVVTWTRICLAWILEILELCSRPDGQPQVDKQGLRSLPSWGNKYLLLLRRVMVDDPKRKLWA